MKEDWPTDRRINVIAQNGNEGLHYDEMSNMEIAQDLAIPKPASKYDIVVADKFTGQQVTIDVYALLKALPVRKSPEVEHSIKKLLAAGVRNGGKSYKQDIEEARNQLNLELDYLELMEKLK